MGGPQLAFSTRSFIFNSKMEKIEPRQMEFVYFSHTKDLNPVTR